MGGESSDQELRSNRFHERTLNWKSCDPVLLGFTTIDQHHNLQFRSTDAMYNYSIKRRTCAFTIFSLFLILTNGFAVVRLPYFQLNGNQTENNIWCPKLNFTLGNNFEIVLFFAHLHSKFATSVTMTPQHWVWKTQYWYKFEMFSNLLTPALKTSL